MPTPITELVETTSSPLTSMYRLIRTYVSLAEEEIIAFDIVLQFRCQRSFRQMNDATTVIARSDLQGPLRSFRVGGVLHEAVSATSAGAFCGDVSSLQQRGRRTQRG